MPAPATRSPSTIRRLRSLRPVLEVQRGAPPDGWDRCVRALGGGPFQCTSWAEYSAVGPHKEPVFFAWYQPGSLVPIAVALAVETTFPGPLAARSLHFDAPPATAVAPGRLIPDIRHWMRSQRGMADAWLGSFDSTHGWADAGEPPTRVEFHVEAGDEERLVRNMRKLARRSIRKAGRHGLEFEPDSEQMRQFVDLYAGTLDRLHHTKGVPTTVGDPDALAQRLSRLRATGTAQLFLASASGAPVAGCLFTVFGRHAFYLLGGSDDRGRESGAMAALLNQALGYFSAHGVARINLGGVPAGAADPEHPDHGLYQFKRGMGGVPHPCRDLRIVVRPGRGRLVGAARAARSTVLAHRAHPRRSPADVSATPAPGSR